MDPRRLVTRQSLAADLSDLGLMAGDTVLVHASMRSIGWVCGGATAVVQALFDVLGRHGTIAAPSQTPDNRDPSRWNHRPVPEEWWPTIRESLPGFDPAVTPSSGMGAIAERIRTWPGAFRSDHPQTSFTAVGLRAAELTAEHALSSPLGERSPLAKLEKADAKVLMLGVGYGKCTAFHLAEYRLPDPPKRQYTCVVSTSRGPEWVSYEAPHLDQGDFPDLGAAFEAEGGRVAVGNVGAAPSRLFPLRTAVGFAVKWLPGHRHRAAIPPFVRAR